MPARSSRRCTAFTTVARGVSTTSVKIPIGSKVTVTVRFAVTVTLQTPVPLHKPPADQNAAEPAAGVGVRVMVVPLATVTEHVVPQLIPSGVLVTVPEPLPD